MSESGLVSRRPDVAGMTRLRLQLEENPSPTELERTREKIFSRLADTPRGVVLDCEEVGTTSIDALAMLQTSQTFAASEGKRLVLYKIGAEFGKVITNHDDIFHFDIYGFTPPSKKPPPAKPKRKPLMKPETFKRVRNIGILVGILFPIVAGVEYYLIYSSQSSVVIDEKSFESGRAPFQLSGTVEESEGDSRVPVAGAMVIAWIPGSGNDGVEKAWTTRTDEDGNYELPLQADSPSHQLMVQVLVSKPDTGEASDEEAGERTSRISQVYDTSLVRGSIRSLDALFP